MATVLLPHPFESDLLFTRAQALRAGLTDRDLADGVRSGYLVRLRHGFYALASVYAKLDDRGRHVLLARAVVAAQRGEVVLAGASAAAVLGFDLFQQDLTLVHVARLDRGSGRRETKVVHHVGALTDSDVVELDGLLVTSPARTVWDVACQSTLEGAVVTADSALRTSNSLAEDLRSYAGRFASARGSRSARLALQLADPRSESVGESVSRVGFYRGAVPMPDLQSKIYDAQGNLIGRSDFDWKEYRHLGEFDGKVKYERYVREGESASDVVIREKIREDRMRATRRGMSRIVWSMVMPSRLRSSMQGLQQALIDSRCLFVVRP